MNQNTLKVKTPQEQLALWLANNQPVVFMQLAKRASVQGQLHGVTDWIKAAGSSIGTAVKSVGSFLTSQEGIATLSTVGGLYLQTQAQRDALRLQIAQVQAQNSLYPIQSVGTQPSSSLPVYVDPRTGQATPLTPQLTSQLMPSTLARYWPVFVLGGLSLFAFALARK